ncbi:hypothetical protein MYCTH_2313008 [Thermothelomyces thermophilus ATCC 42464]|uniref:Uncharacterized protein n=1 Tax=Thermothelomyces thermophilus (strain ATCC 42464 / BCRC 31852 / DSM 1799) TaxID=573729 RepID=G2QNJ7_THET4|nr:uncharacterized protein MYCTH_2313008 [Thermothelomyces thermophilus ATCC 42464]AEO62070.1 hypothetical protein MYCTH_2313008 [Thermothelomyces thermophilus ATCC 42464]
MYDFVVWSSCVGYVTILRWWIETPLLGQWPRSELHHEVVKVLGLQLSGGTSSKKIVR